MKEKSISDRKREHIELALRSQMDAWSNDRRFNYEPMLNAHPADKDIESDFFGKKLRFPLWVSSMTGGTPEAQKINERLAEACKEFGLGMGLGSCRILLEDPSFESEFAVRKLIGDQPLFANLGIAQIEKTLAAKDFDSIRRMIDQLKADGLIIHVNPMQEFLQPEGDRISNSPIDSIQSVLEFADFPIIVKEVGQGMGKKSLDRLMDLPIGIEFAAYGGTNFAQLEIQRQEKSKGQEPMANVGHNVDEMIDAFNELLKEKSKRSFKHVIISGGIKSFLDGYYVNERIKTPSLYGQASGLLVPARESYEALKEYIEEQIRGYQLAQSYLSLRT